jgi:hypothetical protein
MQVNVLSLLYYILTVLTHYIYQPRIQPNEQRPWKYYVAIVWEVDPLAFK